jgi:hypothetical protein
MNFLWRLTVGAVLTVVLALPAAAQSLRVIDGDTIVINKVH